MTTGTVMNIMKKLSISDALSMKNNFPQSSLLRACYEERINPVSYFQATFDYPITLMSAMFDSGCVLSGSRALEFFIPGSVRPESDWDFYVPAYKESVVDMVNALQICGVNWNTDANIIASDITQGGRAIISRRMLENLVTWVTSLGEEPASLVLGKELYAIAHAYSQRAEAFNDINTFEINLDADKNIHFIPIIQLSAYESENEKIPYNDPLGRSFSILYGTIETPRGRERVQLIIGSYYAGIKSCMAFIRDFYASHVQCFIGGWCASHLYYRQTTMKQATVWRHASEKNDAKILRAIQKYKTRGFEFTDAKGSGVRIRALNDDDAFLVDYGNIYRAFIPEYCSSILNDWLNKRRENISAISWTEYDGRIVGIHSVMERYYRTCNVTFADSGRQLPMSARRRLGNIIAVNTKSPDRLRSAGYRSAVGKDVMKNGWEMQTVARSGTTSCYFQDATPWSWTL